MKAIVTGHSAGLGEAIARALLARNIPVLGLARRAHPGLSQAFPAAFTEVALDLGDTTAVLGFLASPAWSAWVQDADALWLINNAATLGPVAAPGTQDGAQMATAISLNVTAPMLLSNAVIQACTGPIRIVHVSSGAARSAYAGWSIYGASKAALDHHARCVQQDGLARVRIASIAPGVIDTEMQTAVRACSSTQFPLVDRFHALKASGQLASPQQVANKLLGYMASDGFGTQPCVDLRDLQDH